MRLLSKGASDKMAVRQRWRSHSHSHQPYKVTDSSYTLPYLSLSLLSVDLVYDNDLSRLYQTVKYVRFFTICSQIRLILIVSTKTFVPPSSSAIIMRSLLSYLPRRLLRWYFDYAPLKSFRPARELTKIARKVSKILVEEKRQEALVDSEKKVKRDILGLMGSFVPLWHRLYLTLNQVRANLSNNDDAYLTDEELWATLTWADTVCVNKRADSLARYSALVMSRRRILWLGVFKNWLSSRMYRKSFARKSLICGMKYLSVVIPSPQAPTSTKWSTLRLSSKWQIHLWYWLDTDVWIGNPSFLSRLVLQSKSIQSGPSITIVETSPPQEW